MGWVASEGPLAWVGLRRKAHGLGCVGRPTRMGYFLMPRLTWLSFFFSILYLVLKKLIKQIIEPD
jgi:hypothetical protein